MNHLLEGLKNSGFEISKKNYYLNGQFIMINDDHRDPWLPRREDVPGEI